MLSHLMRETFKYSPPKGEIQVFYQDEDVLVLNKPCGLLSVPGRDPAHRDSLQTRIQDIYPTATTVHRLDMDTSGLVIMALNADAHRGLSRQFELKTCKKVYIAIVDGVVKAQSGQVDLPLRCDWPNRPLQIVDPVQGKKALTHWRVLERLDECTRLELTPITGRSHQLRVHCLSLGHAILGDRFYGTEAVIARSPRLCLHAFSLKIMQPLTKKELHFTCPADF